MCEVSQKVPGRTSPPSCDGYYILMILYMIFVPAIITIAANSYIPADWFGITVPILVSVITLLYSYVCIRTSKLNKPDNLFGLYLPMIAFIAWQLFTCVISNLFKITSNALLMILYGFTSLNFYGLFMTEDNWTKIKLYGAIYTISILSGFIVGERLAYYKSRVVRTPFQKKHIVLTLICSISLLFISEVVQYYRTLNIVEYQVFESR